MDIKVRKFITYLLLSDHLNKNIINLINKYSQINPYQGWRLRKEQCHFKDCKNGSCGTIVCRNKQHTVGIRNDEICRNRKYHECYYMTSRFGTSLKCLDCCSLFDY
jgi:hypothetical protein